ncbi:unnamed protein product, partial [marine sediment metagenome]
DQLYGNNPLSELVIADNFTSQEVKKAAQSVNKALKNKRDQKAYKKKSARTRKKQQRS